MSNQKVVGFSALDIGSLFKILGHTESSCYFSSYETFIKISDDFDDINAFCLDDGLSYILGKTDPCVEKFDVHILRGLHN